MLQVWQIEKVTLATSVAFAERITAHKTSPIMQLNGVFLFLWVVCMKDGYGFGNNEIGLSSEGYGLG